jgi:hypothetical protein
MSELSVMVRIVSSKIDFKVIHTTWWMAWGFLEYEYVLSWPLVCVLNVNHASSKRNNFSYFLFIQHWTWASGISHSTVDLGYCFTELVATFMPWHILHRCIANEVFIQQKCLMSTNNLLCMNHNSWVAIWHSSTDKMTRHLADSLCIREAVFPYAQRTDYRYTLYLPIWNISLVVGDHTVKLIVYIWSVWKLSLQVC